MMLIWHFEESWLNLNKDALPLANALNMNEESPNECIKIQNAIYLISNLCKYLYFLRADFERF